VARPAAALHGLARQVAVLEAYHGRPDGEAPGADESNPDLQLLRSREKVTLAPDADAVRVLLRLGYGSERGDDAVQYRSVAKAVGPELKSEWRWLEKARALLRTHGQEVCRRAAPQCETCPLTASCRWFLSRRRPG
jgi:endonuclease III